MIKRSGQGDGGFNSRQFQFGFTEQRVLFRGIAIATGEAGAESAWTVGDSGSGVGGTT